MLMLIRGIVFGIVKWAAALALGGAILWQVAEHCGPLKGIAYVHVVKGQVEVTVDDRAYWVETLWESPIVCELRPGRHMLRMLKDGRTLFEQEFTLEPGQEVVLTAWEASNEKRDDASPPVNPLLSRSQLARRSP